MRPLMPKQIGELDGDLRVPEHLLPAALKPGMKRTMDVLADWPWVTHKDLSGLLGVTAQRTSQLTIPLVQGQMACRIYMQGRERLALSEWGWAVLARRDRTSVGRLRSQWNVENVRWQGPEKRGGKSLAGGAGCWHATWSILNQSTASLPSCRGRPSPATSACATCWSLLTRLPGTSSTTTRRDQFIPMPFGMLEKGDKLLPFFLEWERRAVRPGTMADRLAPYLRYYSSLNPLRRSRSQWPLVLIVFDDMLVESRFHSVARREMAKERESNCRCGCLTRK